MKRYQAIFFDWDGTAVVSRKAPPDPVIGPMKALLRRGIPLIIISGTTYDNIAGGKLETYFTAEELGHLFLGLGRGAYNYRFDESGAPVIWRDNIPSREDLLKIHEVCFTVHQRLLRDYGLRTDIVFSRPNYCKIDLMVACDRGDQLFLQGSEIAALKQLLGSCGFHGGLPGLIRLSKEIATEHGMTLSVTSDAKYLEIGITDKSDNVDAMLGLLADERGIQPSECCYWGDEYIGLDEGLYGSDSFMMTERSKPGDFFDVSDAKGVRPEKVKQVGNGVDSFTGFLAAQAF